MTATTPLASSRASPHVHREWLSRREAEYRSAAIAHHFALWLIQLGASPDLIRDALVIVDDELAHAELAHRVCNAVGAPVAQPLSHETLQLTPNTRMSLFENTVLAGVRVFCLGETVAVRLFSHLRTSCTQPIAKEALDRIVVDEVRHRDFGWNFLDWVLTHHDSNRVRTMVTEYLPDMLAQLEASYGCSAVGVDGFTEPDRPWGLAPARDYAQILQRTIANDYVPRFARHDILLPEGGGTRARSN